MARAAVGFRVKSGWAAAVLVGGSVAAPCVLDSRRVDLADPEAPDARQPYHPGLEIHGLRGERETARLVAAVERYARQSLGRLFRAYRDARRRPVAAAIVAGSVVDPAAIANPHIRAHAEEGRLFRELIHRAAKAARLRVLVVVEKELFPLAARVLGRPERRLKDALAALGRDVAGPWRAEEKQAALAAWLVLGRRG